MSGALCYPPCKFGFHGNGPVCWENCPAETYECGALCAEDADGCTDTVKNTVKDVITLAAQIAATVFGDIDVMKIAEDAGLIVDDLAHSKCEDPAAIFV